jgi:hypothetical protein
MACRQFREDVLSLTEQSLDFHRQRGHDPPRSHSDRRLSLESPAPIGLPLSSPPVTSTKAAMPLIQGSWCVDADYGWAVVPGDGVCVAFPAEPEPVLVTRGAPTDSTSPSRSSWLRMSSTASGGFTRESAICRIDAATART